MLKKLRLTSFEQYLIWLTMLLVGLYFLVTWKTVKYSFVDTGRTIGLIFMVVFLIGYTLSLSWDLNEIITFKYKIIEDNEFSTTEYKARALKVWFLFIVTWEPVKTKSHSYEVQNIFGAKHKDYFSTEVSFYDKEKMLKEIENHKLNTKEKWDKFFKRKSKEKVEKVTYL